MESKKLTQKEITELIISGELIITSKDLIIEAVKEHATDLYKDDGEFNNNRFITQRTFESLQEEDLSDLADNIIWYLTND
jgi:hypothetical protein